MSSLRTRKPRLQTPLPTTRQVLSLTTYRRVSLRQNRLCRAFQSRNFSVPSAMLKFGLGPRLHLENVQKSRDWPAPRGSSASVAMQRKQASKTADKPLSICVAKLVLSNHNCTTRQRFLQALGLCDRNNQSKYAGPTVRTNRNRHLGKSIFRGLSWDPSRNKKTSKLENDAKCSTINTCQTYLVSAAGNQKTSLP